MNSTMQPYSRNDFQFVTYQINPTLLGLKVQGTHNGYWQYPIQPPVSKPPSIPKMIEIDRINDIEYIKDLIADLEKVIPRVRIHTNLKDNMHHHRFPGKWFMIWKLRAEAKFSVNFEEPTFLFRDGFEREHEQCTYDFELAMPESTVEALNLLQLFTIIRA